MQLSNDQRLPLYQHTTCYKDIPDCETGSLCLDSRNICDGTCHCQNCADERSCDILEHNICEKNEFRCRNGMCIPEEFLFDGDLDCMDSSDEQRKREFEKFEQCYNDIRMECDERICSKEWYSCGDGTCMPWHKALTNNNQALCKNYRHLSFRCELENLHTSSNGICTRSTNNTDNIAQWDNVTDCEYYLPKVFYDNEIDEIFRNNCVNESSLYYYPSQAIYTPYLYTAYDPRRLLDDPYDIEPHAYCLEGTSVCNQNISTTIDNKTCYLDTTIKSANYPYPPFNYLFCNLSSHSQSLAQSSLLTANGFLCSTQENISLHRLRDGYFDCLLSKEDEIITITNNSTNREKSHYTCLDNKRSLLRQLLGDGIDDCDDGSDEISETTDWSEYQCLDDSDFACQLLKEKCSLSDAKLPFNDYCNSFFNLINGSDEKDCHNWTCRNETFQCSSGQCILMEWMCDGEWDCPDGFDELNCTVISLKKLTTNIWASMCDPISEHVCFTYEFLQNPNNTRPCLSYKNAGDNIVHCIGGSDERNTLTCADGKMLGDRFQCDNGTCISYQHVCDNVADCSKNEDETLCYWKMNNSCSQNRFSCIDGICLNSELRCKTIEPHCSQLENFLWCPSSRVRDRDTYKYRDDDRGWYHQYNDICPVDNSSISKNESSSQQKSTSHCNKGKLLIKNNSTWTCFCSPAYYGLNCEYQRHRMTIRLRINRLSHIHALTTPILRIFVFLVCNMIVHDQITFYDVLFHSWEYKHQRYLLFNRIAYRYDHKCNVRIEAYNITTSTNEKNPINLLAVWKYDIKFHFLPSNRLSKLLSFADDQTIIQLCAINECENNGTCHQIQNDKNQTHCVCQRGYYGEQCQYSNENSCTNIQCSYQALCLSKQSTDKDLCICPANKFGPKCLMNNAVCSSNPCQHNGTCHPVYMDGLEYEYFCQCTSDYHGPSCLLRTAVIIVQNLTLTSPLLTKTKGASVIQLINNSNGSSDIEQQTLYHHTYLPSTIEYRRQKRLLPLAVQQTYVQFDNQVEFHLYLLYHACTINIENVSITNRVECSNVKSLFEKLNIPINVKNYHLPCKYDKSLRCFFDEDYLCICDKHNDPVQCYLYDHHFHICRNQTCLQKGVCLHGNIYNGGDWICVCPNCAYGRLCQFSSYGNRFSLESLVGQDFSPVISSPYTYLHFVPSIILLVIGSVFNFFSFITFSRKASRKNGSGIYLLTNSIVSLLTLYALFFRLIHVRQSRTNKIEIKLNQVLCKSLPYLLNALSRTSPWLLAFVAGERALVALFATNKYINKIKSPLSACILSLLLILCTCSTSSPLIVQHDIIIDSSDNSV
ncbi:unnamed protein product, partial [Didymodactylos carnosus]